MKKFFSEFQIENKPERLIKLLFNWRIWILGGVLGALLGVGVYAVFPPKYRAYTSVVVDHNIEEAFVFFEDRDLFTFMNRESEKLKAVAWSDDVLRNVAEEADGASFEELLSGDIKLTVAQDGLWSFYADHDDPVLASDIAYSWAMEFVESSYAAVEVSAELEIARDSLEDFLADNPDAELRDINPYLAEIRTLQEGTKGISQYIDIEFVGLHSEHGIGIGQGVYVIVGALLLSLFSILILLIIPQKNREENV